MATYKKMEVEKGGSTNVFRIVKKGEVNYSDYYADVVVLDPSTKLPISGLTKSLLPVNEGFDIFFTPAETNLLPLGNYLVVVEITKDPVGNRVLSDLTYRKEVSWQLEITASLINI